MTRKIRSVTRGKKESTDRLPDAFNEGAILVERLEAQRMIAQVAERLRIRREGGYHGVDVLLFFIFLFAARLGLGIKEFGERTRPHKRQLAALGSRRMLPSPPSVSRALSAVEEEDLGEFGPWLLLEGAGAHDCLRHPSAMMRDCRGERWHVFDFDPTVTVLRRRALPEGDDLPEPRRRAQQAEAGYTGRKRGDVQMSRATLQHAGSGLWMGIWTSAGNGTWRRSSAAAVQTVVRTCAALGHCTTRALIRVDGAGGNTPFITACQKANVSYVTRSAHYTILMDPDVRAYLNANDWFIVEDSRSGPRRQAVDLGWRLLPCESVNEDGAPFEQVRSRIVVSRFPANEPRGSGWFDGGWHYEMFVTDLSPDAMPAPEVVTCYYARTSIENRFRQEDRELDLDHVYSYHIPGQNLANLVGLFVWNLEICRAFKMTADLPEIPPQLERSPRVVQEKVEMAGATEASACPDAMDLGAPVEQTASPDAKTEPSSPERDIASVRRFLVGLDWGKLMLPHEGWTWNPDAAALVCPDGKLAKFAGVNVATSAGCGTVRFLASLTDCKACPIRTTCTNSIAPTYRKEKAITVPISTTETIAKLRPITRASSRASPRADGPATPAPAVVRWVKPAIASSCALLAAAYAILLPAVLRGIFREACRDTEIHVTVVEPTDETESSCPVYATTPAERQKRRLTWNENIARNAISPDTRVSIHMALGDPVAELFRREELATKSDFKPLIA